MGLESINWQLLVYSVLHDLAIAVYIGGSVVMDFILGPAQQSIPPAQAQIMGQKTSDRFLVLVWVSLGVIVVTGFLRLQEKGFIVAEWPPFAGLLNWEFSYGRTVFVMFIIWVLLVVNGALITFVLRPRLLGRLGSGTSTRQVTTSMDSKLQAAQWVQWLTRTDMALAVLAALLGASLILGGLL